MRKIWDIPGGIHPPENKTQSLGDTIRPAGIPPELVVPAAQHIGAPAKPVVSPGDNVLKGQVIAEANGFVSAPVHAPTSGKIVAVENRPVPHPSGLDALCVVIATDGEDRWIDHHGVDDWSTLERTELLEIIRNAGISGMGGAGFPSAVKLNPPPDKPIDTLILNGTECEPYITADHALMRERAEEIVQGALILQKIIQPTDQTVIGIEDNKPDAISAMQRAAEGTTIEIASFPTKYPSGGEKQLIQILTGREVKSGGLPADVGVVCQNIGTATAIYRAVTAGEPLISRITTITGNACSKNCNLEVLLGTPVQWLLERCGFDEKRCSRLVMGGPMMGYALTDTSVPIVKTSNCILAPDRAELPPPPPPQACIRCGLCAEACPVSLLPQQMYWFARGMEYEKLEQHNLFDCIECGACSYSCPSNIPLVQYYRAAKGEIIQQRKDHEKAEHSKLRFEARKERLEREEREKEAKRKARLEAAKAKAEKAGDDKGDPKAAIIEAAIARSKAKKQDVDPAAAAIEKAKAARAAAADQSPREKLEKQLAGFDKRITALQKTLDTTEDADKREIMQASLQKMQDKRSTCEQELAALPPESGSVPAPEATENADPAAAAIAKAKAAREAAAQQTPEQKREAAIASLQQRIAKTTDKLAAAREAGDDTADILQTTLEKLQAKLDDAMKEGDS